MNREKILLNHLAELRCFLNDLMIEDDKEMLYRKLILQGKIELLIDLLENFKS